MKLIFNKKTLIIFIIVMVIFNTIIPSYSYGFDFGGIIFKPLNTLLITMTDGVNGLLAIFFGGVSELIDFSGDNISNFLASPEYIFANKYPLLRANLFSSDTIDVGDGGGVVNTSTLDTAVNGVGTSTIGYLRKAVAGVYVLLRNVCAVVLLCLLIYTGIRIVLSSSNPQEQSKWKAYLTDWLKAMGLLVFMHLIMITIFNITDKLAQALAESLTADKSISAILRDNAMSSWDFVQQVMATFMYIYTTYLTIVFSISYFKRVIWTSILIVVAPIVAALYAMGGHGKDIYKRWFKEFLVNCFIQPFHVIVFYILIIIPIMVANGHADSGLSLDLLDTTFNMIYCLIAMSMIRPAEKYIRDLFNMNGKVASTAAFENGKASIDAVGRVIKDLAITIGGAVATGGASVGLKAAGKAVQVASNVSQASGKANGIGSNPSALGAFQGATDQKNPTGIGPGSATPFNADGQGIGSPKPGSANGQGVGSPNSTNPNEIDTQTHELGELSQDLKGNAFQRAGNRFINTKVGATGKALFSSEGIDNMMKLRGSLHELHDTMGMGVVSPDSSWKNSFIAQEITERNKAKAEANVNLISSNKDNIKYIIDQKGLQNKWEEIYKDENGHVNKAKAEQKAEEEAKAFLKDLSQQYVKHGITDVQSMYALYSHGKDHNIVGPSEIIKDFYSQNKADKMENKMRLKAEDKITEKIKLEIENSPTKSYEMIGPDGKKLIVDKNNINSEIVKQAIKDRAPYANAVHGAKQSVNVNLKDMDRQMEMKVNLEAHHISVKDPQNLKDLDKVVGRIMNMSPDKKQKTLDKAGDEMKQIIELEIKRREDANENH